MRHFLSPSRSVTLGAALLAAFVAGCARDSTTLDLGTRAVVIGVDGADWKLIDALAAEGAMPNFARLREGGTWGRIATLPDIPLSPVIWTSVATGKTAAKHGVAWFMVDRPDGTRVPVRSYNRKTKAPVRGPQSSSCKAKQVSDLGGQVSAYQRVRLQPSKLTFAVATGGS